MSTITKQKVGEGCQENSALIEAMNFLDKKGKTYDIQDMSNVEPINSQRIDSKTNVLIITSHEIILPKRNK